MNTKEAIQAMLDGKKVRCKEWEEEDCIQFNGIYFSFTNGMQFIFGSLEYDWEIYEEPNPVQTVTIEKWLCIEDGKNYCIYEGDANYFNAIEIFETKKVKLLDTYEVTL